MHKESFKEMLDKLIATTSHYQYNDFLTILKLIPVQLSICFIDYRVEPLPIFLLDIGLFVFYLLKLLFGETFDYKCKNTS